MRIIRPTYNRWNGLKGIEYFKDAKYILPESQKDKYLKVLGSKQMIVIPDECDGSIAKKRNWMLENIKRPYISIDDDVEYMLMMEGRSKEKRKFVSYKKIESKLIHSIFEHYTNLADQLNAKMWGVMQRNTGDQREYREHRPFTLTNAVLGPFHCHLDHDLKYDEDMLNKEDYDMVIQMFSVYKMILRVDKLAIKGEQQGNEGGIVGERTLEIELKGARNIMNKWGSRIIKYNLNPQKMNDVVSGKLNIPINGV